MRTSIAGQPARAALTLAAPLLLAALAACDGTTSVLGPGGAEFAATTGTSAVAGGMTSAALLGRWTRVEGTAAGIVVETTFAFLSGGTGSRTVVTRTPLGAVVAADQQPFSWSGGGGLLLLRFPGPLGGETLLRASFAIETALTGTTLRLDGLAYRRTGG